MECSQVGASDYTAWIRFLKEPRDALSDGGDCMRGSESVLNKEVMHTRNCQGMGSYFVGIHAWWPQRDSNPCFGLERAAS